MDAPGWKFTELCPSRGNQEHAVGDLVSVKLVGKIFSDNPIISASAIVVN